MKQASRQSRFTSRQHLLAAAIATCFVMEAQALPVAPTVVSGSAGFATAGNTLTVTNSASAIINWQKFGIAAGETTRFIQPSASSTVLNQVVGTGSGALEMSKIYGTLSSNGRVWLVNPAGIMIGPGGMVDTAGFVASTLKIKPEDFLAGRLNFEATAGAGDVINQGTIKTPLGGSVYLVGSNVSNESIITTPGGETILAAGATVNLIDTATPGVKVEITGAANNATNLGTIVAEAGRIGIAGSIVRNSGTLNASSVSSEGGRVFLKASQDTYVDGNGRIVANGTKGGQVEVLGNRVAVMDSAEIDVSGTNAGGTILVGGDYQGKNSAVQNSQITYFGQDATLKANATDNGDGGKVIVWADDTTRAFGKIEAKGAGGGKGGFVETSGKRHLNINGIRVVTGGGEWLLDPDSITIYPSTTPSGGSWSDTDSNGYSDFFTSGNADSVVSWSTIYSNLYYGGVTLTTTGNTTFTPGSYYGWVGNNFYGYPSYLSIAAGGNVILDNTTINMYGGGLHLLAGWNGTPLANYGYYYGYQAFSYATPGIGNISAIGSNINAYVVELGAGGNINFTGSITSSDYIGIGSLGTTTIGSGSSLTSTYGQDIYGQNGVSITGTTISSGNWLDIWGWNGPVTVSNSTLTANSGWMWIEGPTVNISGTTATAAYGLDIGSYYSDYCGIGDYCNDGMKSDFIPSNVSSSGLFLPPYNPTTKLTISNSTLTGNGEGVHLESDGSTVISNSTISAPTPGTTTYTWYDQYGNPYYETYLNGELGIAAAGDIIVTNSSLSGKSFVMMAAMGNMSFTGSSVNAGDDAAFILGSATSEVRLNNSYVISDTYTNIPATNYLYFFGRSSDGVMIDGVATTSSTAGGSGFFVVDHNTPATPGYGLELVYATTTATPAPTNEVINEFNNLTDDQVIITSPLPIDPALQQAEAEQTTGEGEGEFGGDGKGKGKKKAAQCKG